MTEPMSPQAPPAPALKRRHGCLTAIIIVFGVLSAISTVVNLVMSGTLAANLPGAPSWAPTGIIVMGLLGLLGVASLIALWFWKRIGLYAYVALGIVILALNLALGVYTGVLGLVGVALVLIFVLRQWEDFE